MKPRSHAGTRGVSVIELLVVIAIIAILTGIGITQFDRSRFHVAEAASVLSSDLIRARTEAIRLNRPVRVAFDIDNSSYSVGEFDSCGDSAPVREIWTRDLVSSYDLSELESINVPSGDVWFDTRGLPRDGCSGLAEPVRITVQSVRDATIQRVVRVELQGSVESE